MGSVKEAKSAATTKYYKSRHLKVRLTPRQKVQVKIVNWKRCSIRWLLLISYTALLHLIGFVVITCICYDLIEEHKGKDNNNWMMWTYLATPFLISLFLCGCGLSLRGITYHWKRTEFVLGICLLVVATLAYGGTFSIYYIPGIAHHGTILKPDIRNGKDGKHDKWELITLKYAILVMTVALPAVSVIGIIGSCISAVVAITVIPKSFKEEPIDAVWLEPYGIYDFYFRRNIPRVPGWDEVFEDVHAPVEEYYDSDSDTPSDVAPTIATERTERISASSMSTVTANTNNQITRKSDQEKETILKK